MKHKSDNMGAQFVPISIPTVCWKCFPLNSMHMYTCTAGMLSMRTFIVFTKKNSLCVLFLAFSVIFDKLKFTSFYHKVLVSAFL